MSRRRKTLITLGMVLGVAILVPVIRHYQLRAATETYLAQLKAQGEPMDLAQVIPPPVPPDQTGAPLFLKAASLLDTNWNVLGSNPPPAMLMVAPGKAAIGWAQPDIRSEEGSNSWEEVKEALAQDKEALELLDQITNSPAFDFNLQYTQRFDMRLTHLISEKRVAQRLTASTVYDLHLSDSSSAAKNIHVILVLVKGTHEERTAISQLVRIAITKIGSMATWELLQSPNLTDEQLAGLQVDWSQLEFIQAAEHVLPVEREGAETTLAQWRSSNSELQRYFNLEKKARETMGYPNDEETFWDKKKMATRIFMWRYWWSYADELRCLKGYEVLLNTMRLADTNGSFQNVLLRQDAALDRLRISRLGNSFDSFLSGENDFHSMLSESIVTLAGVTRKVMSVEVAKRVTLAAIALKRYQLNMELIH